MCKLTSSLGTLRFGINGDGSYGYYKGDDTFVPFSTSSYVSGELDVTGGTAHTIEVGFKPKWIYVHCTNTTNFTAYIQVLTHNSDIDETKSYGTSTSGYLGYQNIPNTSTGAINSIDDNGFTVKPSGSVTHIQWFCGQ